MYNAGDLFLGEYWITTSGRRHSVLYRGETILWFTVAPDRGSRMLG